MSYRTFIQTGAAGFTMLALAYLASIDVDPVEAIKARRAEIVRKSSKLTRGETA